MRWIWGLRMDLGSLSPVPAPHPSLCCPPGGPQLGPKRPGRARSLLGNQRKRRKSTTPDPKEKQTCGENLGLGTWDWDCNPQDETDLR